jgi:hypothetical protein
VVRARETGKSWASGDRFLKSIAPGGVSVAKSGERRAFVEGDVLGLAALDLVLRRFRARMVRVAVNIEIACMDANDRPADAPGFRIPAHMIADLEFVFHEHFRTAWCASDSRGGTNNVFERIMHLKCLLKQRSFES